MKYAHSIKITVFTKPEDRTMNPQIDNIIDEKIKTLVALDFEKEKISIIKNNAESFENRTIIIHELSLTKESHTNTFIKNILGKLDNAQKELLLNQRWSRLDENNDFFIRFDLRNFLDDKFVLTDGGDCIHFRFTIAAFPKTNEAALNVIKNMLS